MAGATEAKQPDLGTVFAAHVRHEFLDKDVEATMRTMVAEPYVHNVATLTGAVGNVGVHRFYSEHFVGKLPADIKFDRPVCGARPHRRDEVRG